MEGKKHTVALAGFLITITGSILFSTKAIIVKVAFAHTHMDALTLLMLRMTFSLPFYLAAVWLTRQKGLTPLTTRQWLGVIGLGLFGYYLSSLFDFVGLQYVTAGLERLILFLYPTFAVLINTFIFKQPVVRTQKIALLLTYTGIGIAYLGELNIDTSNPNFFWGSFLIFLCSITYSVYIVGSGRMIPTVGVTRFTAYAMLASTAGVFTHFALQGRGLHDLQQGGTPIIWYGILLATIATVLPTFMMSTGMKHIGSNNVAIISAVGPVSTIIQAHFILGEKIFTAQIIGTVLVVIGVILIGWKRK
ncbi:MULTISPECIES: DMT family transporter [Niastella]|uniref:EamA family transporter n=1 Tax=Niastella soli TaxID=2821487 RepID=A0ABS3YV98_9BACT|nr:DMT family transporter [Niastella soli]MBO9201845.1 EamA family transporter [Niastella soli]